MLALKIVAVVFAGISLVMAIIALVLNIQTGKDIKRQYEELERQEQESIKRQKIQAETMRLYEEYLSAKSDYACYGGDDSSTNGQYS